MQGYARRYGLSDLGGIDELAMRSEQVSLGLVERPAVPVDLSFCWRDVVTVFLIIIDPCAVDATGVAHGDAHPSWRDLWRPCGPIALPQS